jgi:hypothetical protein
MRPHRKKKVTFLIIYLAAGKNNLNDFKPIDFMSLKEELRQASYFLDHPLARFLLRECTSYR